MKYSGNELCDCVLTSPRRSKKILLLFLITKILYKFAPIIYTLKETQLIIS